MDVLSQLGVSWKSEGVDKSDQSGDFVKAEIEDSEASLRLTI